MFAKDCSRFFKLIDTELVLILLVHRNQLVSARLKNNSRCDFISHTESSRSGADGCEIIQIINYLVTQGLTTMYDPHCVSFIVPYQASSTILAKCYESILQQKDAGLQIEIVLVEGAGAQKLTSALKLSTTTVVVKVAGLGAAQARNTGLTVARGKWIAFVDSDTVLADDWLSTLSALMRTHHCAGAQGLLITTATSADSTFARFRKLQDTFGEQGMLNAKLFLPVLNTAACLYDREKLGELRFTTQLRAVEDMELSWRLLMAHKVSWLYTKRTSATCFYFPESIFDFCLRNFRIGKSYVELFRALPTSHLKSAQVSSSKIYPWFFSELKKATRSSDLAQWGRALCSFTFWLGTLVGDKALPQLPAPQGAHRLIIYDDSFERIDLATGARWSVGGLTHE